MSGSSSTTSTSGGAFDIRLVRSSDRGGFCRGGPGLSSISAITSPGRTREHVCCQTQPHRLSVFPEIASTALVMQPLCGDDDSWRGCSPDERLGCGANVVALA